MFPDLALWLIPASELDTTNKMIIYFTSLNYFSLSTLGLEETVGDLNPILFTNLSFRFYKYSSTHYYLHLVTIIEILNSSVNIVIQ